MMGNTKPDARTPAELRRLAEERVAADENEFPKGTDQTSPEFLRRIVHDLSVHQIELEMQNEELRRAQDDIEHERTKYFEFYNIAPVGYVTVSAKGLILESNLTLASLLGVPRRSLIMLPFSRFIANEDTALYYLYVKQLFTTGSAPACDLRVVTNEGAVLWANLAGTMAEDADGASVCRFVVSDVTERKRMEAHLLQAKIEAETANQAKSAFLANMSHEIRTPLNGLLGMNELALKGAIPPNIRQYLLYAKQAGKALLEIINDILDLSKIESGKANLVENPFLLRENLESLLAPFSVAAQEKGLSFRHSVAMDVPDQLIGDLGRLTQVLTNLLGNAIKFTHAGTVRISVVLDHEPAPPGSARLLFRVKDDGIGIPDDRLEEIFKAFSQVGLSSHVNYGGTGLGLSISKSLVEMMNGRIWAESTVGKGSTFHYTAMFGVAEERLPGAEAHMTDSSPSRTLRILLAEDDMLNAILAEQLLTERGHQVVIAKNGREALERLTAETFDLVLMDVRMPVMDGVAATQTIRRGEAGKANSDIPIVALTAHALKGDRERFLAAGMDDYLSKPIDIAELDRVLAGIAATRDDRAPKH